jgi:tetratricopeptide (TPR) repeat protein
MGKFSEAIRSSQRASELQEELVKNNPSVIEFQAKLATSYLNIGEQQRQAKQLDHALESLQRARDVFERLLRVQPAVIEFQIGLAACDINLSLLRAKSEPQVALDGFARSIATVETVLRKEPRHAVARSILFQAHWGRAWAFGELQCHAEAVGERDRALELDDGSSQHGLRLQRAISLAKLGEHVQATAEANALADQKSVAGGPLYDLACIHSLSSAAVRQDAHLSPTERDLRVEQHAGRAVELLVKAQAAGYFQVPARVEHLKKDKDFDSLRDREDFKKLLAELEDLPLPGQAFRPR